MNLVTQIGCIAMGIMMSLSLSARAEPVVFQSTDTPPYWSPKLQENSFGGAVLRLLSTAADVPYSIEYLPIKRFRNSVSPFLVGDPDILNYPKNRMILPFGIFRSAFLYYKPHHDVITFKSLRDLNGYTLGVLRGTIEGKEDFERNGVNVEESDSVESLLKKLKRGRIDFCIVVEGTARYMIQQLFAAEQDNFILVMIPRLDRPIAMMIDMDDPAARLVARRYQQVLESTLRSKQYQMLVSQFYGDHTPKDRDETLNKFVQYYANTGRK